MYRGTDAVQVALRHDLTPHGLFATKFHLIWQLLVKPRIIARQTGLAVINPGPVSAFLYIHQHTGELMQLVVSESDGDPAAINEKNVPDLHLFLRIDRFLDRMVERMERVKAGLPAEEPIKKDETENWSGDFSLDADGQRVLVGLTRAESEELVGLMQLMSDDRTTEEQSSRYHELDSKHVYGRARREASRRPKTDEDDFRRAWATDERGSRVMVGLSAEETEEYIRLTAKELAYSMSEDCFQWASVDEMRRENDRSLQLHDKHEMARLARLANEQSTDTS